MQCLYFLIFLVVSQILTNICSNQNPNKVNTVQLIRMPVKSVLTYRFILTLLNPYNLCVEEMELCFPETEFW